MNWLVGKVDFSVSMFIPYSNWNYSDLACVCGPFSSPTVFDSPAITHPLQLTVGIKQAAALPAMDLGVCVSIDKAELNESTLVMKVFDFDRFSKHDIIGELRLQLGTIDWNHVIEEWKNLSDPSKTGSKMCNCSLPLYKLTVVILEAKNLKNPYVKVQLALDKKKWKRKKTSVKKCTQNPYFNESFTFVVSFEQIQVSMILVISVWDHDKFTRNDAIGKIFLGCDATGNQQRHWADMLSNPRKPVAQWHNLFSSEQVDSILELKHSVRIPFINKNF
uniref:Synaptotagmin 8 n=1 Tax=Oncorhynchus mykiss TaxID=8022 RepID=A0A8C7PZZ8_ONCMY